jgi:hypothetical protein
VLQLCVAVFGKSMSTKWSIGGGGWTGESLPTPGSRHSLCHVGVALVITIVE